MLAARVRATLEGRPRGRSRARLAERATALPLADAGRAGRGDGCADRRRARDGRARSRDAGRRGRKRRRSGRCRRQARDISRVVLARARRRARGCCREPTESSRARSARRDLGALRDALLGAGALRRRHGAEPGAMARRAAPRSARGRMGREGDAARADAACERSCRARGHRAAARSGRLPCSARVPAVAAFTRPRPKRSLSSIKATGCCRTMTRRALAWLGDMARVPASLHLADVVDRRASCCAMPRWSQPRVGQLPVVAGEPGSRSGARPIAARAS